MKNNVRVWACDYSLSTGEGNLARLFVKKNLSGDRVIFNKVSKKSINDGFIKKILHYKYISPIVGILYCWYWHLNGKKVCYLNYLPLWNFIIFLFLPPRTVLGPITGGSFFLDISVHSLFRKYIFPLFYQLSITILYFRNTKLLFSTDLLKKYLPKSYLKKSKFNFVFNYLNKKQKKIKNKRSFIIYYKKHKNKENFFPLDLIKKLTKHNFTVNIVGDFLQLDKVKNNGYLSKKKLDRLLSESKYSILSGENIYSLFTIDCISNHITLFVDKKKGYQINYYKDNFKKIDYKNTKFLNKLI